MPITVKESERQDKELRTMENCHREVFEGVDGSGNPVFMSVLVHNQTERWAWSDNFITRAEAENYSEYA